ncbi:hypothetical protein CC80DRAFT_510455 [Byssothecium circinans]|uniref:Uncharacterized protein n=1 Tax=Byssothecium circinans TaxID=147558 RepID=A0A6A5TKM4_9PLEO|nr:hypothetical protein CC80DRAFT_510455 [Byssothecium circinans]
MDFNTPVPQWLWPWVHVADPLKITRYTARNEYDKHLKKAQSGITKLQSLIKKASNRLNACQGIFNDEQRPKRANLLNAQCMILHIGHSYVRLRTVVSHYRRFVMSPNYYLDPDEGCAIGMQSPMEMVCELLKEMEKAIVYIEKYKKSYRSQPESRGNDSSRTVVNFKVLARTKFANRPARLTIHRTKSL